MQYRALSILLFSVCQLHGQDKWKNVYKESAWADRDRWQKANELIRYMQLSEGSQVADVGCHEGYMAFKLASAVGPEGKVYAVDVKQEKLDLLTQHAAARKVENIITVKGAYDDPKLPADSLDAVIIIDAYHEMDNYDKILMHIFNALKHGGRLILCEPLATERKNASRKDQQKEHELGMTYAIDDLKKAGFVIVKQQDPYIERTEKGDLMWLIVAGKI
jgi:ubiquinone/menaquinone biosynthesis C-methylase UbiE